MQDKETYATFYTAENDTNHNHDCRIFKSPTFPASHKTYCIRRRKAQVLPMYKAQAIRHKFVHIHSAISYGQVPRRYIRIFTLLRPTDKIFHIIFKRVGKRTFAENFHRMKFCDSIPDGLEYLG